MRTIQKQIANGGSGVVTNPFTKNKEAEPTEKETIKELTDKLKREMTKPAVEQPKDPDSLGALGGKPDVDEDPAQVELKIPGDPTATPAKDSKDKVYTKEEVLPIMDALLLNGYALESFQLGKATSVVLKTRFAWEEQAALKYAEKSPMTSNMGFQRELNLGILAGSIIQFGNTVFDPLNEGKQEDLDASFEERLTFIKGLNTVFTDIIQKKMFEFDNKQKYLIDHFDELMENF